MLVRLPGAAQAVMLREAVVRPVFDLPTAEHPGEHNIATFLSYCSVVSILLSRMPCWADGLCKSLLPHVVTCAWPRELAFAGAPETHRRCPDDVVVNVPERLWFWSA